MVSRKNVRFRLDAVFLGEGRRLVNSMEDLVEVELGDAPDSFLMRTRHFPEE